ncbi:hypothetical protein PT974_03970 [Cladobotryum mycophilum]|uniref:Uncharacterized protein n=1 Tax=Cladobotryum mycophilum TaxID=491253 RepID=A0ABR0STS3_9HYPO
MRPAQLPPGRMPTAKACTTLQTGQDCTEFVSSTPVQRTPTTSWSTTTRTKCETVYDCEPMDMTITTTITSTPSLSPTDFPSTIEDDPVDGSLTEDQRKAIKADYDEWQKMLEPPPPTTEPSPGPTPGPKPKTAACVIYNDYSLAYRFHITNISGWGDDHGYDLRHQEKGCGKVTLWDWRDATFNEPANVWFDLPTLIKAGCVERAIVSAGGPKIKCEGRGLAPPSGDVTAEQVVQPVPDYIPMDWDNESE